MEMEEKSYNDKLILVYYIDVREVLEEQIPELMSRIMGRIKLESPEIGEIIALPIRNETRVECINPKYITEPELIREHRLKMDFLLEKLNNYIIDNSKDDGK